MPTPERPTLDPGLTVDEVMARHPGTLPVFNALGVDTCCGAGDTLHRAAAEAGLEVSALLRALGDAIGAQA